MPRIAQTTTFWTLHGLYRWDFNGFNKWALIVRDPRLCLIFYFVAQIAQCIIVIGFGLVMPPQSLPSQLGLAEFFVYFVASLLR